MKWLKDLQNSISKTFTGLKLRRQINKLLRILYFEFKDLMDRSSKWKKSSPDSLCGETSTNKYIHEYGVYYDTEKEIVLFKGRHEEKDSKWTYLGSIEQMECGNWEYWAPPNDGSYISTWMLQSILRKCYELNFERDLRMAKISGRPTERKFRHHAVKESNGDECYRVFEKGLYDDFVCECASEWYANLIVDTFNEKFNK